MKKLHLFLASTFVALSVYSKDIPESAVPTNVKAYVSKNYSGIKGIEWEYKKKQDCYKAEFYVDGREIKLQINNSGQLVSSKEDMLIKDIPAFAVSYVRKNYPDAEILGANKKVDGGSTTYDVGIVFENKNGYTRHNNIVFDSKGNVIKK